jgi:hypothetical protein
MAQEDSTTEADGNARQVFDTWRGKIAGGSANGRAPLRVWAALHPDFQYLLELAFQYEDARRLASDRRECGMLTAKDVEQEERAGLLFMTAYWCFMEAHPDQMEH